MAYDTKCYELARAFLEDYEPLAETEIMELAQRIQDVIEAHLDERREYEEAKQWAKILSSSASSSQGPDIWTSGGSMRRRSGCDLDYSPRRCVDGVTHVA